MNGFDVCLCADGNYIDYVPSVIESVLRSNQNKSFVFHVISDDDASDKFLGVLESLGGIDFHWHKIDVAKFDGLKEVSHFTKAMYYRFSIPDLIAADRVLYLDCDVLVRGDISSLFHMDMSGMYVAAVDNPFFSRWQELGVEKKNGYFNSGVMMINCALWRSESVMDKVVHKVSEIGDSLLLPDQDAMNVVFCGKWLRLQQSFNVQYSMLSNFNRYLAESECLPEYLRKPIVVHFSGTNKQWHFSNFSKYAKDYRALETSVTVYKRNFIVDISYRVINFFVYKLIKKNFYLV